MLHRTSILIALRLSRSMSMNIPAIEVERKFSPLPDLADRVLEHGGVVERTIAFDDCYYDTPDWVLSRADIWLRRRDDVWELKTPRGGAEKSGGETSVFTEYEGERTILEVLRGLPDGPEAGTSLPGHLLPFAAFRTTRERWSLPDGTRVDSDVADFGHGVVEVEAMAADKEEIAACESRVLAWGKLLGLSECNNFTGGKLETYLRRNCLEQTEALVRAGVLQK
mmetsp:Transcript_37894/g.88182  ORF Transcript_37894/g.88182 Transcript_37894/m.88182 type:complete len:224 (-) Transcript_37894:31-702(-)